MKYMGSKSRIVSDILPIMLENYSGNTFIDMFCGGCSVIENVPNTFNRIAVDNNQYLIAMWKTLTTKEFTFPTYISKDLYSSYRDKFNQNKGNMTDEDDIIGWIGFMGSYNGRFFDGGYSGHQVKIKEGKYRDYITENINNTLAQVPKLIGVDFRYSKYNEIDVPDGSLIYCDPPYKGTKQYSTSRNFNHDDYYQWLRDMKQTGHTIFASEYQMPDDFNCIWQKELKTTINPELTKKPIERLYSLS